MISRTVWTANSDGTLTPELMAVNPESHCRTSKVATISHGPSVRHSQVRSAQHPQIPRFLQFFRGIWPMPLSLLNHSALALFAQRTRIPTSARSIGFCANWVYISSSSKEARSMGLHSEFFDVRTVGFVVSFKSKASPTTGTLPV